MKIVTKSEEYSFDLPFVYDVKSLLIINATFIGRANGDSEIPAGSFVGRITSSKLCQVYNSSATDGTQNAIGIVLESVPALAPNEVYVAQVAVSGVFIKERLKNFTNDALSDVGGKAIYVDDNTTLIKF